MRLKDWIAWYDPKTDTIHNATEGSLVWWHEAGHREQWKDGRAKFINMFGGQILLVVIGLSSVQHEYAWVPFLMYLGGYMYLEIDAWLYALENKPK